MDSFDPWGIGEALDMGLRMYTHAKRATGRTTLLLDAIQEGDVVVAATQREADRIVRLARDRGFQHVIGRGFEGTLGRNVLAELNEYMMGTGRRVVFDHTFFEALYFWAIRDTMQAMNSIVTRHEEKRARDSKEDRVWIEAVRAIGGDAHIVGDP